MRPRSGSMVGADHTAAPAGPHSCVPVEVLRMGTAASEIVNDCQRCSPVAAS